MDGIVLLLLVSVVLLALSLAMPAVPMPRSKVRRINIRAVKHSLYRPSEGVPPAWWSKRKAERFKALKERIDAEKNYVDSVRQYERTRRKKG
jgi:hypothetical protein